MRSPDSVSNPKAALADHAGSVLCRLLIGHRYVVYIEILGRAELLPGTITYSLGVLLPDGRELYIDVEDTPTPPPRTARKSRRQRASCAARSG